MEPLIQFNEVGFAYDPQRPVLADCDFQLQAGQRVGLIGANGSGKTTLLALTVGLLKPTAGRIKAFGRVRSCEADFYEVRCRAGLLFQDTDDQLFCPTVAEDVAFGPLNLGLARREVERIVSRTLDSLGLAGYESRVTYRLSGGEKRLVALATLLAMNPDVLLLDEPATGLDEQATERVLETLERLPQAMLIVSHDRAFLRRLAHSALRLNRGRLEPGEGQL